MQSDLALADYKDELIECISSRLGITAEKAAKRLAPHLKSDAGSEEEESDGDSDDTAVRVRASLHPPPPQHAVNEKELYLGRRYMASFKCRLNANLVMDDMVARIEEF